MNKKGLERKPIKNFWKDAIAVAITLLFFMPCTAVFANELQLQGEVIVSIAPATQTVNKGEAFTFSVYVEPGDTPIMGMAFRTLSFDQTLIFVDSVVMGDITGNWLSSAPGDIDNVNGEITNAFGFVLPANAITTPGSFIVVSCHALQELGTSDLILFEVDVSDVDNQPIPIIVNNGTSTIEGTDKIWDLYVQWENDSSTPTTVTVSWDTSEFMGCEYNSVVLWRYDPFDEEWDSVVDMLTENEYTYTPRRLGLNWLKDHFQIVATGWSENNSANEPSNPNPINGAPGVDNNADLSWTCDGFVWNVTLNFNETSGRNDYVVFGEAFDANDGEPPDSYDVPKPPESPKPYLRAWFDDNLSIPYKELLKDYRNCIDTVTYDVYFGKNSIPPIVVGNQSDTVYDPGTLDYETKYYWQIVAWDNGALTSGPIWSFTTKSDSGGPPNGEPPQDQNMPPIADANGPYIGAIGIPVTFDGSGSSDPDGDITNYTWHFGDGTEGYGEITDHTYAEAGNYTVALAVTDNGGKKRSNLTYAIITGVANNPPSMPIVTGSGIGQKNTIYNFTAVSTDPDNDTIRYFFDWEDDTNTTSAFLASGVTCNVSHNWTTIGVYRVRVHAEDENNGVSGTTEMIVFIDVNVQFIDDVIRGYLLDTDNDGIYDIFYNNVTGNETDVELQDNGNYLIDSNGNAIWNYEYDPWTGMLASYHSEEESTEEPGYLLVVWIIMIVIAAVIIVVIFVYGDKKLKEKQELKKKIRQEMEEKAEREAKEKEAEQEKKESEEQEDKSKEEEADDKDKAKESTGEESEGGKP